jgi:hypothetical protein
MTTADPALLFLALAIIFVAITVRDFLRSGGALTPARRTWLRVAVIFAAVAIGIHAVRLLFH